MPEIQVLVSGQPPIDDVPNVIGNVSDIIEIICADPAYNLNVSCEGIDDTAHGCVLAVDAPIVQFLTGHKDIYDYQILDGDPIRLVRRAVGTDLVVDLVVDESECILRSAGQPRISYSRVDPLSLPRELEIQYIDPDRLYAMTTQPAVHHGASRNHGKMTVTIAFVLNNDQARKLAYDMLYRMWERQLSLSFEHPNPNIEPGDVLHVTGNRGAYTVLVQDVLLTKDRTSMVKANAMLLSKAGSVVISGGFSDSSGKTSDDWFVVL